MSTMKLAGVGLILVVIGFGAGYYLAAPAGSPSKEGAPSGAIELPPLEPDAVARRAAEAQDAAALRSEAGAAILEVLDEPDAFRRASRLAQLLLELGPDAAPAARAVLRDPILELGGAESSLLARFWAMHEPAAAATWALMRSPSAVRPMAIMVAVELWARADPESAAEATREFTRMPGTIAQAAQIALVRGWLRSGEPGLYAYMRGLGVTFERQRALAWYARDRIRRDGPEKVAEWVTQIPDHDRRFKLDAYRQVASELAKVDPDAAAAFCDAHCEGPYGNNVRRMIAQRWARLDGPAAMEWLSRAPEGEQRDWAVKGAFSGWWGGDRDGLHRWMAGIGPENVEPWLQPALELYALNIAWDRPLDAVRWASAIDHDPARERVLVDVARRWRSQDESAAEAWVAQSPLDEEARERARVPTPPRRQRGPRRAYDALESGELP